MWWCTIIATTIKETVLCFLLLFLLPSPAISLGFTILGEIFAHVTVVLNSFVMVNRKFGS